MAKKIGICALLLVGILGSGCTGNKTGALDTLITSCPGAGVPCGDNCCNPSSDKACLNGVCYPGCGGVFEGYDAAKDTVATFVPLSACFTEAINADGSDK